MLDYSNLRKTVGRSSIEVRERPCLHPLQLMSRELVFHISRVQSRRRLEQQKPAFFFSDRKVLDAARHYDEFAFFNPLVVIAELHAEPALDDQKQFVLMLVMMEDELAFELVELQVLAVEFGGDVRLPIFVDLREFLNDVDFVHDDRVDGEHV